MKAIACLLFVLVTIQVVMADIYNQLQFMKIMSPTNNQNVRAGEKVVFKYAMQPTIKENVSAGFATKLDIFFHARSGNTKLDRISSVFLKCPIRAEEDKYVTHTKTWTIPANTAPGSYAFDFVEGVRLRRGDIVSSETVKVNVVD